MEIIQEEARSSKGRGDRILAAGYAKGFEEGKESGCALGLAANHSGIASTARDSASVSRPASSVHIKR